MEKIIARQLIKKTDTSEIIGYELLVQSDAESLYNSSVDSAAANAMTAFLTENSSKIFRDRKTFMTFTPMLLFRNTPKIFDKDMIVIQIEDNVVIHPLASILIEKYREEGYHFAINDFQFIPKYFSMLEYVDYIKVKVTGEEEDRERRSLENVVEMAHGFGKEVIATSINTKEAFLLAKEIHTDYVEGAYISDTSVSKVGKMEYLQGNLYQLIMEVTKDEPDMEVMEQIVTRDAALTYALLKMANSAYFSAKHRTASVRQAIMRVGINQLKQWVYLLSFREEESGTEELMKTSFMRANFAAALVKKMEHFPIDPADAYLMGMFSTLECMIDATMEEILNEIPIVEEVKKALISGEGEAGTLYHLILAYERADWTEIKKLSDELGLQTNVMAQIYMEFVEEVSEIWENVVAKA